MRGLTDAEEEAIVIAINEDDVNSTSIDDDAVTLLLHEDLVTRGLLRIEHLEWFEDDPDDPRYHFRCEADFYRATRMGRLALYCNHAAKEK